MGTFRRYEGQSSDATHTRKTRHSLLLQLERYGVRRMRAAIRGRVLSHQIGKERKLRVDNRFRRVLTNASQSLKHRLTPWERVGCGYRARATDTLCGLKKPDTMLSLTMLQEVFEPTTQEDRDEATRLVMMLHHSRRGAWHYCNTQCSIACTWPIPMQRHRLLSIKQCWPVDCEIQLSKSDHPQHPTVEYVRSETNELECKTEGRTLYVSDQFEQYQRGDLQEPSKLFVQAVAHLVSTMFISAHRCATIGSRVASMLLDFGYTLRTGVVRQTTQFHLMNGALHVKKEPVVFEELVPRIIAAESRHYMLSGVRQISWRTHLNVQWKKACNLPFPLVGGAFATCMCPQCGWKPDEHTQMTPIESNSYAWLLVRLFEILTTEVCVLEPSIKPAETWTQFVPRLHCYIVR